ncbi:MAG: PadR family transcriptional regulator [Candidatus Aenigmarchaeota archaeon]|nr:PadR family transcriptional regulator [Candidatus Aenigmarchaeota archaeon]
MHEPINRLERKVRKENLWIYILTLLEKKELYAFEIRDIINKEFGFWIGNVTAYKVLYLLEQGKYVSSSLRHNKVYYKITPAGRKQLRAAMNFFRDILRRC